MIKKRILLITLAIAAVSPLLSKESIQIATDHARRINAVAMNHKGTQILTLSKDKTAKVWDINTQSLVQTFHHTDAVLAGAFNANDTLLFTQCRTPWSTVSSEIRHSEKLITRVWETSTGKMLYEFSSGSNYGDPSVIFSTTGRLIASVMHGQVTLRDAISGTILHTFKVPWDHIVKMKFSPHDTHLILETVLGIDSWDTVTGENNISICGNTFYKTISDDGTLIALAGHFGDIELLNRETGELTYIPSPEGSTGRLVISPDNKKITRGNTLLEIPSGKVICTLQVTSEHINLTFSPDSKHLLIVHAGAWYIKKRYLNQKGPHISPVNNRLAYTLFESTSATPSGTFDYATFCPQNPAGWYMLTLQESVVVAHKNPC